MIEQRNWSRGWRGMVLILVGGFIGASLVSPAMAHVGGTVGHLWNKHIKGKVIALGDPRWVNTDEGAGGDVSGTHADLQLNGDSVGSPEIATDAVGSSEIAASAVSAGEVADNSLGAADLGANSVGASEVNLVLGTPVTSSILAANVEGNGSAITTSATVSCASGQEIIGVSVDWNPDPVANEELYVVESRRMSGISWRVWGANDTNTDRTFTLTPLCLA